MPRSTVSHPILPLLMASVSLTLACSSQEPAEPPPRAMSLIDHWAEVTIEQATQPGDPSPKGIIPFDGEASDLQWSVVQGIESLEWVDGQLRGRTTSESPVLLIELPAPLGEDDRLWSAKIRAQASAGTRLGIHPLDEAGPPLPAVVGRIEAWPLSSPLVAGDEAGAYEIQVDKVFTLEMPMAKRAIQRFLVRPTNEAGADFAIESIQFVFRRERLDSIPSGPGWHGLNEVYRETLVARTPEVLRFPASLSAQPWLHLSVGTVETETPTFHVHVVGPSGERHSFEPLALTEAESWLSTRFDLSPWAGQDVEIHLSTEGAAGSLAFWGAPTLRDASPSLAEKRPETVVVFLADTLRSDHLEAWGHARETSPTLTRLASEGVRFSDAIAQATWTKVSVSSLLTSLHPSTTGIVGINDRLPFGETTLAEAFREAGYATFATSSVPFTGQLTNLHQGVEVLYEFGANTSDDVYQSKTARSWVDAYLEWLDLHQDVPTLALVHAMDPHSPFQPEPPFDTLFTAPGDAERFEAQSQALEPHIKSPLLRRFMAPSRAEIEIAGVDEASFVEHEKNWYDGSIRGMDQQLARIVARFEKDGLVERSLIAFVTDHGEEFLEHGRHWHGQTVYGEVANVPMVFWGAGVPAGRVVDTTVSNVDVLPTLLDLAGLPIPERAQGRSLVPLLNGQGDSSRVPPAFIEHRDEEEFDRFAMIADGYKLILNVDPPEGFAAYELYDHSQDPLDLNDLASQEAERVETMAAELARWRTWAESQKLDEEAEQANLSAEELERLRSLGYVE